MGEFVLIIAAYLIGSIPTSVWVSRKIFNIDIRDYGSGNAGTTNTFRILGKKWAIIVLIVDVLKGSLASFLYLLIPIYHENELYRVNFMICLGLAAVLGHIFPIWADFRGGKGIATLLGMALAIQPIVALCCLIVFVIILLLTKFVSLSSIIAGISFMIFILFIFNEPEPIYRFFAIAVALTVVLTHQKNIGKLLKGKENKISFKKNNLLN